MCLKVLVFTHGKSNLVKRLSANTCLDGTWCVCSCLTQRNTHTSTVLPFIIDPFRTNGPLEICLLGNNVPYWISILYSVTFAFCHQVLLTRTFDEVTEAAPIRGTGCLVAKTEVVPFGPLECKRKHVCAFGDGGMRVFSCCAGGGEESGGAAQ